MSAGRSRLRPTRPLRSFFAPALVGLLSTLPVSLARPRPAAAQGMGMPVGPNGMPDLRFMSGKSRPDPADPAGQVTVRVVKKTFANPAVGVEVTLLGKNAGGDVRKRTATTNDQGRAVFDAVAPGSTVTLEATVDGERLHAEPFTQPGQAGIRTLLVAGLGAPPANAAAGAKSQEPTGGVAAGDETAGGEAEGFNQGVATGKVRIDPALPLKTILVRTFDREGRPLAGQAVELGQVGLEGAEKVKVLRQTTAADGTTTFSGLPVGTKIGYAVAMVSGGLRLGTEAFALPEDGGGVVAELRAVGRTNDPNVISIGEGGRIVLEFNEDVVQVLEFLPLVNDSQDVFDAEPGGYPIPLPREFVSAEGAEGDAPVEVRKGFGVASHMRVPPGPPPVVREGHAPNEVRFGFSVPFHGSSLTLEQPMPGGLGAFTFIAQKLDGLNVESPSFSGARSERQIGGHTFYLWPASAIRRGGVLSFRVTGLPSHERPGRTVAAILVAGLIIGAIALSWRKGAGQRPSGVDDHDTLVEERERLFEKLMALERERETKRAGGDLNETAWNAERKKVVERLETVLRALGAGTAPVVGQAPLPSKAARAKA